ncbi:MAG TPA: D-2-hydroxyacid dehydrogenase [Longilinea sp.]|nr:D-2-hydroxyacid dehydrogenase [Longilinea sp.]
MSEKIEVLMTIQYPPEQLAKIKAVSDRLNITLIPAIKVEEIPADVWARTEVLYTDRVLPTEAQAPNLRFIQFHYAGIDPAAEAPILRKTDLVAATLSGANSAQVAEYSVAMMISLGHHLPALLAGQAKTEWPHDRWERYYPAELRGSTVGLVPYGSIAREIARLLVPFGVTILAAKRNAMDPTDRGYMPEGLGDPEGNLFKRLYPVEALKSMLKECDFVVVSLPLTPHTRSLIGAEELAAMKPSAFLVDCGRGWVIDQPALIQALQEKRIAGAALDVFPQEPLPPDNPLWRMPNAIITPHIAGISSDYDQHAAAMFSENLRRYVDGGAIYNRFDPEKGY